ncbi:transmembrane 220 family protein [Pontibacter sp. Tf4]|uniref:transmembrane 220 family protein n=1 Tax=Pontibacter sp. Tf4 TaxID=2761620 RepID=UPI00162438B8|nr:transmembrane 220 family protein [Pontibacter sp. Tf4]MBB6610735.1 transmembrane 220 family protein [Pontibacter sp. Tf4]
MLRITTGIILCLLFISFAAMQYNDPDPALWIAIYVVAGAICVLAAFGKLPMVVMAVACAACVIGAFMVWPVKYEGLEVGGGDIKNIEEARESLGLLLIGLVMFFYAILPGRVRNITTSEPSLRT